MIKLLVGEALLKGIFEKLLISSFSHLNDLCHVGGTHLLINRKPEREEANILKMLNVDRSLALQLRPSKVRRVCCIQKPAKIIYLLSTNKLSTLHTGRQKKGLKKIYRLVSFHWKEFIAVLSFMLKLNIFVFIYLFKFTFYFCGEKIQN